MVIWLYRFWKKGLHLLAKDRATLAFSKNRVLLLWIFLGWIQRTLYNLACSFYTRYCQCTVYIQNDLLPYICNEEKFYDPITPFFVGKVVSSILVEKREFHFLKIIWIHITTDIWWISQCKNQFYLYNGNFIWCDWGWKSCSACFILQTVLWNDINMNTIFQTLRKGRLLSNICFSCLF